MNYPRKRIGLNRKSNQGIALVCWTNARITSPPNLYNSRGIFRRVSGISYFALIFFLSLTTRFAFQAVIGGTRSDLNGSQEILPDLERKVRWYMEP
jgi:hypothetical protein